MHDSPVLSTPLKYQFHSCFPQLPLLNIDSSSTNIALYCTADLFLLCQSQTRCSSPTTSVAHILQRVQHLHGLTWTLLNWCATNQTPAQLTRWLRKLVLTALTLAAAVIWLAPFLQAARSCVPQPDSDPVHSSHLASCVQVSDHAVQLLLASRDSLNLLWRGTQVVTHF